MTDVFADANGFKGASGMPRATGVRVVHNSNVGRGHVPAGAGTTKSVQTRSSVLSAACAVGTPGRRALRPTERTLTVGRDHWARRCRNYRLRTNPFVCAVSRFADGTPGRRALRAAYRSCSVGRDHWARRCRNYRLRTNLFVCTVCRFAVGGHMCPLYRH